MIDKKGIKIAILSYCVRELACKIRRKGKTAGPAYFTKTRAMEEIKELKKVNFCRTFRSSRSPMFFKIVVLKISQISQENTCVAVSF